MSFTSLRVFASAALLAALSTPFVRPALGQAQLPPLIPVRHFFDNPEIAGAQISPDGKWISYLKPYRDKLNIHLRAMLESVR